MNSSFNWKKSVNQFLIVMVALSAINLIGGLYFSNSLITRQAEAQQLDMAAEYAGNLPYHVSQIQQFLTDVSATGERGGFDEAAGHFTEANKLLGELKKLRPQDASKLDDISQKLKAFDEVGIKMAEVYLAKGQSAGNASMKQPEVGFDDRADTLVKAVSAYIEPLNTVNDATKKAISDAAHTLRNGIAIINLLSAACLAFIVISLGKRLATYLGADPNALGVAVKSIADGDYDKPVKVSGGDTNSIMAMLREMQGALKQGAIQASENARIRTALDSVSTSVMIADANRTIIYVNPAQARMLADCEADIRKDLPQFSAGNIVGTSIDQFHKQPSHQRNILDRLSGAHDANLAIGVRRFKLTMNRILNAQGEPLGTVVEWIDQTQQLAQIERDRIAAAEMARVMNALECVELPIRIVDPQGTILYVNRALQDTVRRIAPRLKIQRPLIDPEKLVGSNIGLFYDDPAATVARLAGLQTVARSRVDIGGRIFDVITNPMFDTQGKNIGTVGQWIDMTDQLLVEQEIGQVLEAANTGNFAERIDIGNKQGFFKVLAESLNRLMEVSDRGLAEVVRMLDALAHGDLTQRIDGDYLGTFGQLKDDSNLTAEKLTDIIGQIKEATDTITTAAEEIASGNQNLSQRTESQAASLEETASSMEELTSTVKQNAENAKQANQLARGASDIAVKGGGVVGQVVNTMQEINTSAKKIVDIISVIDGIAFQTNILALNAAVEAARAGEQGRGFAVVASEVRNLAQRSAAAAKEIKGLIGDSVEKVESGSKLVNEAGKTMDEVVAAVKRVTDIMSEISAASVEQSAGIEQVNTTITQMDDMTQQNAALVEQAAAASLSMQEQAQLLARSVDAFKLTQTIGKPLALRSTTAVTKSFSFGEAITAHQKWKTRLVAYINNTGNEILDADKVSRDDVCDLGCWIHGAAKSHANRAEYRKLREAHAQFHLSVGDIVKTVQAGNRDAARKLLGGPFFAHSNHTIDAIRQLQAVVEGNRSDRTQVAVKSAKQANSASADEWEEF